ncbi:MAG: hypothetical protein ACK4TF_06335 [Thermodesulfovibrionales bacterium]
MNKRTVLILIVLIVSGATSNGQEATPSMPPPTPLFQPPVIENPLPGDTRPENFELRFEDNKVYLKADGANLKEVLTRLAQKAGFDISMSSSPTKISTLIEGLSLEDTIHRIMNIVQERNYNIYYDEKGGINKLEVLSSAETPPATPRQIPQRPVTPRPRIPRVPQAPQTGPVPDEIQQPAQIIPQDDEDLQ